MCTHTFRWLNLNSQERNITRSKAAPDISSPAVVVPTSFLDQTSSDAQCEPVAESSCQASEGTICDDQSIAAEDETPEADKAKEFMDGQLSSLETLLGYFEMDRPRHLKGGAHTRTFQNVNDELPREVDSGFSEEDMDRGEVLQNLWRAAFAQASAV